MLEKVRQHNAKTHTSVGACILLFMLFTALGIALSGIAETAGIFAPIIEKFSILTISPLVSPAISAVIVILIVRLEIYGYPSSKMPIIIVYLEHIG